MADTTTKSNEQNWLLVEWGNGVWGVVNLKCIQNKENTSLVEDSLVMIRKRGEMQLATLIAKSSQRSVLDRMAADHEKARPSTPPDEDSDFSTSDVSWKPSDDNSSGSDEVVSKNLSKKSGNKIITKKVLAKQINKRKFMQKSFILKKLKERIMKARIAGNHDDNLDSAKKKETQKLEMLLVAKRDINHIDLELGRILGLMKSVPGMEIDETLDKEPEPLSPLDANISVQKADMPENNRSRSIESNRSDDGVLISNKFNIASVATENTQNNHDNDSEMVPIGSGKTLIPRDKFRKVKWTSYTIATRTLLVAAFPREILATHSLTGKRSPAFQNKPAKMCLDPKIISDIIIEVTDRFNVGENLVRSIITTKCADECKMDKNKMSKSGTTQKKEEKNETAPNPTEQSKPE